MRRLFPWVATVGCATLLAVGCAARRPQVEPSLAGRAGRVPVVLVPGLTGTALIDRDSGRPAWGDGKRLLFPRDGGLSTALPLDGSAPAAEPGAAIGSIRLLGGLIRRDVYDPVVGLMRANGYRVGDLDRPDPESTFFVFPYDWRRSAVDVAALLRERLDALRRARGEERLVVDLIVQSNAAQIARYLLKYGGEPLERAEAGTAALPPTLAVDKLVLVGTANGGALRVLREMNRGRRYIAVFGRKLRPEVLFTYPSLFEALPGYRDDLFLDGGGRTLDIDLFDADPWIRYGWSIYADAALRRARRPEASAIFVDRAAVDRHLERSLDRARRLQALLLKDPEDFFPPRIYMIQNLFRETAERAVVSCADTSKCATRFGGDRGLRAGSALHSRTVSPGDGHASVFSQNALSEAERAAVADDPFYVDDRHFEMILHPAAQRRLVEILAE